LVLQFRKVRAIAVPMKKWRRRFGLRPAQQSPPSFASPRRAGCVLSDWRRIDRISPLVKHDRNIRAASCVQPCHEGKVHRLEAKRMRHVLHQDARRILAEVSIEKRDRARSEMAGKRAPRRRHRSIGRPHAGAQMFTTSPARASSTATRRV